MAKAFGVEQDTQASVPRPNTSNYPVSTSVRPIDISSAAHTLTVGLTDYLKKQKGLELGQDIAKANQRIQAITNPVERQLARDNAYDQLLAQHGADAAPVINQALRARKTTQVERDNIIYNADENGNILSRVEGQSPTTHADALTSHLMDQATQLEANAPTYAAYVSTATNTLKEAGINVGLGDVATMLHSANDLFNGTINKAAIMSSQLHDTSVNQTIYEARKKRLGMQVRNELFTALEDFRNGTFSAALRKQGTPLTPQIVADLAQTMVSDYIQQLHRTGTDTALELDVQTLQKDASAYVKGLGDYYTFQRDGQALKAESAKRYSDAIRGEMVNQAFFNIVKKSPAILNYVAMEPMYKNIAAVSMVRDQLGPSGPQSDAATRSFLFNLDLALGESIAYSNAHDRLIKTYPADARSIQAMTEDFRNVKHYGLGTWEYEDSINYVLKQMPVMEALATKDPQIKGALTNLKNQLTDSKKALEQAKKEVGVTSEDLKNTSQDLTALRGAQSGKPWWEWFGNAAKNFVNGPDNSRTRPTNGSDQAQ